MAERTELADALQAWMRRQRITQPASLARLAKVSRPTVYTALRGERVSGDSIRALARGLATDPYSGDVDPIAYAEALRDLAEAGGHPALVTDAPPPVSLEAAIRAEGVRSPRQAAKLAAFLRKYPNLTPNELRLVDAVIDNLEEK